MRTVRSAAWSRNRPRRRVAWLLLVILLVLIALVARVDAAPGASTGAMHHADAEPAGALDEDGDEEAEERAAERAEIDDGEDAEEIDDTARLAGAQASLAPGGDDAGARSGLALDGEAGAPASLVLDGDDTGTQASLVLDEDDAAPGSAGPGTLAMLDAELAPGDATAGLDAADAGAMAGAQEMYEQWMRHQRPSPWGRLDVGVSWRRRWSAPMHAPAHRHDEIWLVATWRR